MKNAKLINRRNFLKLGGGAVALTAIPIKLVAADEVSADEPLAQAMGYALFEEVLLDRAGKVLNPNFLDYKIASSLDVPELVTILVPTYEPTGPYGAKSVSEICINGPLPAISNAIFDATGARLVSSPYTAERVWIALQGGKA